MKDEATMLDYRKWIERASAFTESLRKLPGTVQVEVCVDPPISWEEIEKFAGRLRLGIPSPFFDFLTQGSANCLCHYWWQPTKHLSHSLELLFDSPSTTFFWGGAQFCETSNMYYDQIGLFDQGDDYREGTKDRDYWLNSVPIIPVGNGDYVGLYIGTARSSQDYPVVYLNHDGYVTGTIFSLTFDQFLMDWESLCYIGLDLWVLYFLDASGSISAEKRQLLHKLFRDALNNP